MPSYALSMNLKVSSYTSELGTVTLMLVESWIIVIKSPFKFSKSDAGPPLIGSTVTEVTGHPGLELVNYPSSYNVAG